MPHGAKIATCNYCGTRAALVLKGEVRHELACSACGAPLHELKALKLAAPDAAPRRAAAASARPRPARPQKKVRKSRGKSGLRDILDEAFDLIDDIFD